MFDYRLLIDLASNQENTNIIPYGHIYIYIYIYIYIWSSSSENQAYMRTLRTKKCITFLQVLLLHKKCVTFVFKKIWYFLLKKCNFQKKKYKCKVTRFSGKITPFNIKSNTFLWFSHKDGFHLNFSLCVRVYIYILEVIKHRAGWKKTAHWCGRGRAEVRS